MSSQNLQQEYYLNKQVLILKRMNFFFFFFSNYIKQCLKQDQQATPVYTFPKCKRTFMVLTTLAQNVTKDLSKSDSCYIPNREIMQHYSI